MPQINPIGWTLELIMPVIALTVLAIVLPRALARVLPFTLPGVALNLLVSALVMIAVGACLFLVIYLIRQPGLGGILSAHPGAAAAWLGKLGLMPAIIWLPVLILVGLGLAQKVEASR